MASKVDLAALSVDGLFKQLTLEGLDKNIATAFKKEKVTGQDFLELTPEDLKETIPNLSLGSKKAIQRIQAQYSSKSPVRSLYCRNCILHHCLVLKLLMNCGKSQSF